jgi:hypothetical protein
MEAFCQLITCFASEDFRENQLPQFTQELIGQKAAVPSHQMLPSSDQSYGEKGGKLSVPMGGSRLGGGMNG